MQTDMQIDMQTTVMQHKCMLENGKNQSSNHDHPLLGSFSVLGTMSSALCILFCLVLTATLWNIYYHLSDFINEETKARRD